ncbi:MAG: hypothetical protein NT029_10945 [Armatimonadetes bacterium]|nr:hypothetical protein [Armatimonadota bacterium]
MSVDVCYVIAQGFAARTVLHTGAVPALRDRGHTVSVLVPHGTSGSLADTASRLGITLHEAPPLQGRYEYFSDVVRRYLTEDVRANPALWARHVRILAEGVGRKKVLSARLGYAANRILRPWAATEPLVRLLEQILLVNPAMETALRRIDPRVLVSTYPVEPLESCLLLAAQRRGISTVGQLLSWDNITSKGRFPVSPDRYLSWGPIMTEEIREYYRVPAGRVRDCGVAHFDAHVRSVSPGRIAANLTALGLDPSKPYILVGMSSPFFCPNEIDIVEWLASAVAEGRFGPDIQLVVRPHPLNVTGYLADQSWLPRLDRLKGPRVGVDYPTLKEGKLVWNMDESDLPHLANLLAGCAVSLNSGSTFTIDAIIHDKPVVMTAFDADQQRPWWQSARRVVEYKHLAKLLALGGVRAAHSYDDLAAAVAGYLADPARDAAGRARVRERECGPCDGRAAERQAQALADVVTGAWR